MEDWIPFAAAAVGSAGVAGAITTATQFSYQRRLESSLRRLAIAKEQAANDSLALKAINQAIRTDALLLAATRLHRATPLGVLGAIVVAVILIGLIVVLGIVAAVSVVAELSDSAGMWISLGVFTAYVLLLAALAHFLRRDNQATWVATALASTYDPIITPEVTRGRRRIARSLRRRKSFIRLRNARWHNAGADEHWAKMRKIAERRVKRRKSILWSAESWLSSDRLVTAWPYRHIADQRSPSAVEVTVSE